MTAPTPVRTGMRLLQAASPALAARVAERLFFTPPRTRSGPEVRAFLSRGRRLDLRVDGRRVVTWSLGAGPRVYLVHGWGGRGGRLHSIATPLVEAGYSVAWFDAPGHGAAGRGMSSMPEFARALLAVERTYGPAHAVVTHSMGGAAAALAAGWGFDARRYVFLAPPANPASWAIPFATALGLRREVVEALRARSERRLRIHWTDLDVPAIARRMARPLLVVHDRDDVTVPWLDGATIADAWPGARLMTTGGLGHRGIVRDPGVVGEVVRFLKEDAAASRERPEELPDGKRAVVASSQ
jgi:pimeloyl-ACP methyl ester carboxylesterase